MRRIGRTTYAEWLLLSRDRGFWVIHAVLAALVFYGAQVGGSWAQLQQRTIAEARDHERQALAALREAIARDGTNVASRPGWAPLFRYAILPPPPLMALAIGESDLRASVVRVGLDSAHFLASREEIQNPHNLLAGRFDVAFVVVYLLPLAILLTGAGTLTRERETGTLPLAVASAGSVSALAVGKAVARGALVLAVMCGAAVVALPLSGAGIQAVDTVARIALWLLVACAYGAFWWALALLIDAAAGRETTKAVVAIVLWAVVVLVVPGLVQLAAQVTYPAMPRTEEVLHAREAWRRLAPQADRLLADLYEQRPGLAPAAGRGERHDPIAAHYAVQLELERQLRPIVEAHEAQRARQRNLAGWLAYVSPAAVAHDVLAAVAGTGRDGYEAFGRAAERLDQQWRRMLLPMVFRGEPLSTAHADMLPRFAIERMPWPAAGTIAGALAGILLPGLGALALAVRALRRLETFEV